VISLEYQADVFPALNVQTQLERGWNVALTADVAGPITIAKPTSTRLPGVISTHARLVDDGVTLSLITFIVFTDLRTGIEGGQPKKV
jgi:hypothetical protein